MFVPTLTPLLLALALMLLLMSLLARACPRLAVNIIYARLCPATVDSFARYCLFELGFEVLLQGLSRVQWI
jgi:hypothetical protein